MEYPNNLAAQALRTQILELVEQYMRTTQAEKQAFIAGQSSVPVSGRVYEAVDVKTLVDSSLDFWLTTGRFNTQFQRALTKLLGVRYALTVNSGSSANLAAFATLTSHLLKERALQAGDEVITVAAGFPTTLNPILLYKVTPVFVDIDIPTYNINVNQLEAAVSEKTRAIFLAHTLGNPFNLKVITEFAKKHNLWLIEDCCDALCSTYDNQLVGTFGDIGTLSFYPAHHITMGEGGAVFTSRPKLKRILESIINWGRDCYCEPGEENSCGKRFDWQLGELPLGYDHKYTYSHIGYNLKITDMQAAVGCAQLSHLPKFVAARKTNFANLKQGLNDLQDYFILPEATPNSDPAWFGLPLTIRDGAPFQREQLLMYLNQHKIGTRLLFGGNLTRQPYMLNQPYRVADHLNNSDIAMNNAFWLGVYPGLSEAHITYMIEIMHQFIDTL